jgi:pyruvate formate lyase activating enzyme
VCPGGTGEGYPRFSHTEGPEYGYKNLAVFYNGCTFNCLFCQNWHHKGVTQRAKWTRVEELVDAIDEKTSCICYFGGDPSAQLPHAIATSHYAIKRSKGAILRICWETNGSMSRAYLEEMLSISIQTGGCIKFDLKAYDERLNIALCGISNKRTLDNFAFLAGFSAQRPRPPLVIASTLLIPGYVDEDEVSKIAGFIASLSKDIPYSLLAYHPQFCMTDLPTTSRSHALGCLQVAKEQGLTKVKLGNVHLLREVDYPSPMT